VAEGSIGHADGIATGGLAASQGRRRTPRTTDSRHQLPTAPNLLARNFAAERPDQVWLADISYLPTDEGWLYLAAIKDLATREILGWSMADHLRAELCLDALVMALQRCQATCKTGPSASSVQPGWVGERG